eukprot:5209161-Prymnesium_polylepis.1
MLARDVLRTHGPAPPPGACVYFKGLTYRRYRAVLRRRNSHTVPRTASPFTIERVLLLVVSQYSSLRPGPTGPSLTFGY